MTDLSIFNTAIGDIKEPAIFPDGKYIVTCAKHEVGTAGKKDTPYCDLTFRVNEALDGQDLSDFDLTAYNLTDRMWLTDKSAFYVMQNLKQINPDSENAESIGDAVENYVVGSQVIVNVGPDKSSTSDRRKVILRYETLGYK